MVSASAIEHLTGARQFRSSGSSALALTGEGCARLGIIQLPAGDAGSTGADEFLARDPALCVGTVIWTGALRLWPRS